jgi:hypothetical protein
MNTPQKYDLFQVLTTIFGHCKEYFLDKFGVDSPSLNFAEKKRQSNLHALASLQTQSMKIASGIQQSLTEFYLTASQTAPRNDGLKQKFSFLKPQVFWMNYIERTYHLASGQFIHYDKHKICHDLSDDTLTGATHRFWREQ